MFSFSQEATLVKKATTPSDEPTPGYVFHELVGLTQKSVESSQKLQDLLLERLEKDSPVIKLKSLRVIKHLLLKAHPSFKRELATRVDQIRPALNYRGPPDPLHGDSPYQMVRTEAQDVVNMLFNTDQASYTSSSASFSDDYSKKSIGSTGIKSDNFGAMATISRAKDDIISNTLDLKNKITAKIYSNTGPPTFRNSELSNFGGFGSPGSYTPTQPTTSATTQQHEVGRPGGDWAAYNKDNHNKSHHNDDEESLLVEEFTASSGIPSPSFSVVSQFCNRCASLDPYRISELLYDKVSSSRAWQSKQKAVVAVEALLQGTNSTPYIEFFSNNYEAIAALTTSVHAVTREKAKKALSLLVESNPDIAEAVNAPASSSQATHYTPDPSQQPQAQLTPTNSLFDGLSLSDNVPSSPTPNSPNPARTTSARAPRSPAPTAASRNTAPLISLLDDSEAPTPAPASPHPTAQPVFNLVDGGDPFDPLSPSSTAPASPQIATPAPTSAPNNVPPATASPNSNTSSFDDLLSLSTPSTIPQQQPQHPHHHQQPPPPFPYNSYKPTPYPYAMPPQPYPYAPHQPTPTPYPYAPQQSVFFKDPTTPTTPVYTPPPNGYAPMRPNMMSGNIPLGPAAHDQQQNSSSSSYDSFNFVNAKKKDTFGDLVNQQITNINTK